MATLKLLGVLSREELAGLQFRAFQFGLDMAAQQALSARGFVWINTPGNSRLEQLAAGRSNVRVALRVTRLDPVMLPISQALQNCAVMQSYYERVHAVLT